MTGLAGELERELQGKFYYSATVLVDDFTEVIDGVTSITGTTIGIAEPACRIAGIGGSTSSVRDTHSRVADSVQREKDIATSQVSRSSIDLRRIRLIEHVEEPGAKLQLLRLTEAKVLEDRDVEVAPAGSPDVEGWLRRPRVRKCRNLKGRKVVCLLI